MLNIQACYTEVITKQSPLKFFGLVLILSLPFWLLGIVAPSSLLPYSLPISALMFICPMLAALILTARQGGRKEIKKLLQRAFDLHVIKNKWWLLISALIMPVVMLIAWYLMQYLGYPLPTPRIALAMIPVMILVYFFGAIGEEVGWMGYLFDPLQKRMGVLSAALTIGIFWGAWHIIPFYTMGRSAGWIAAQVIASIFMRIIIARLYNKANKSVLIAIIFHTFINVSTSLFPNQGSHYNPAIAAFMLALLVICIEIIAIVNNRRKSLLVLSK